MINKGGASRTPRTWAEGDVIPGDVNRMKDKLGGEWSKDGRFWSLTDQYGEEWHRTDDGLLRDFAPVVEVSSAPEPSVIEVVTKRPKLLTTPCWWVNTNDCWEISHFPTREKAEDWHIKGVRRDHGTPLSIAGAFEREPAEVAQETECCYELDCPDCGDSCHQQELVGECVWCGARLDITALLGGAA
jgi:hypothetical protein